MQASTASTGINTTAITVTKSQEQILIQSSGAMIAIIVIGIILILTVLLIVLKTYNRCTHASRVLGSSTKPRPKMSQSTARSNLPLTPMGVNSVSGSISVSENGFRVPSMELGSQDEGSQGPSENSFRLPRVELSSVDETMENLEQSSAASTEVTIHELPVMENT
ncbi:unnamed protein product [Knipowitschia caucasica]